MIHVYSVIYYHNKDHEVKLHIYDDGFEEVCNIVAEVWVHEPNNAYTIVDNRD